MQVVVEEGPLSQRLATPSKYVGQTVTVAGGEERNNGGSGGGYEQSWEVLDVGSTKERGAE